MPCGGIYPEKSSWAEDYHYDNSPCFVCNKPSGKIDDNLWVEEWDTSIHRKCLEAFMKTDEGKIVIAHGHSIVLNWD